MINASSILLTGTCDNLQVDSYSFSTNCSSTAFSNPENVNTNCNDLNSPPYGQTEACTDSSPLPASPFSATLQILDYGQDTGCDSANLARYYYYPVGVCFFLGNPGDISDVQVWSKVTCSSGAAAVVTYTDSDCTEVYTGEEAYTAAIELGTCSDDIPTFTSDSVVTGTYQFATCVTSASSRLAVMSNVFIAMVVAASGWLAQH